MAEEVIKKKGRLAAAVLAGSSLAFGSFALSMPAALAAEAQEPPTEEVTEPADLDTQDDAPAGDGDEGTDSVDESQEADEADESETEASSEPSSEPEASERSEERRVGKERRARGGGKPEKQKEDTDKGEHEAQK